MLSLKSITNFNTRTRFLEPPFKMYILSLHCMYTYMYIEGELLYICRPFSESYSELEGVQERASRPLEWIRVGGNADHH